MLLEGVYVDTNLCLVLVPPSVECDDQGNRLWRAYGALAADDTSTWTDILVGDGVQPVVRFPSTKTEGECVLKEVKSEPTLQCVKTLRSNWLSAKPS